MILSTKSDMVDIYFDKIIKVFVMVLRVFAVSSTFSPFFLSFVNRLFTVYDCRVRIDDTFE